MLKLTKLIFTLSLKFERWSLGKIIFLVVSALTKIVPLTLVNPFIYSIEPLLRCGDARVSFGVHYSSFDPKFDAFVFSALDYAVS